MTAVHRTLQSDDPLAIELAAALKQGEVERISHLLEAERESSLYEIEECVSRSPYRTASAERCRFLGRDGNKIIPASYLRSMYSF